MVKTVTNTNDFRRYSYQYDTSYLVDSFSGSRTAQAPKYSPVPTNEPQHRLKVRENKALKTKSLLKSEQRAAFLKAVKIIAVTVFCFVLAAMAVNSLSAKNELTKQIEAKEKSISNAQSENISLQSKLDSLVSVSMIDEYAVNKLGMTKVKANQIQYIDVDAYRTNRESELKGNAKADTAKNQNASAKSNK